MVNEAVSVRADIHTGNDWIETVFNVQAELILPAGANLTSDVNPIYIGNMGPGPSDASCGWTVVFEEPGMYTLEVNASCIDTQLLPRWLINSTTVEVHDHPHVEFVYSRNIYPNQTVIFNATKSHACGPHGEIVSYEWSFGDGTNITTDNPVVEHAFNMVGNYTVSLNVTDNRGFSSVTTAGIRIGLLGDINMDNIVDIVDVSIVAYSYHTHSGDERWNAECDLNEDGVINILDLSLVAKEYGKAV